MAKEVNQFHQMNCLNPIRNVVDASARSFGWMADHALSLTVQNSVGVLLFHRVGDFEANPTWNVRQHQFERILRKLLERGLVPLRLSDAVAEKESLGARRGFVVTFDDGYRSVLTNALPVLERLGIPATLFLTTGEIDRPVPFSVDDWKLKGKKHVCEESWKPLSLNDCLQLKASGLIEFGSHTHSHHDFRGNRDALEQDLETSKNWLIDHDLAADSIPFSFPFGNSRFGFCDAHLVEVVKRVGMSCALTADPELLTPQDDRFSIGRFLVRDEDTPTAVCGRLNAGYTWAKRFIRCASAGSQKLIFSNPGVGVQPPQIPVNENADVVVAAKPKLAAAGSGKFTSAP